MKRKDINATDQQYGGPAVLARNDGAESPEFRDDEPIKQPNKRRVALEDFRAYMVMHKYIFTDTGEMWPATSVNARIPPILFADGKEIKASTWLDIKRPVEQITWMPGKPQVIRNEIIIEGGWVDRPGCSVFNFYRPPTIRHGDASKAGPWIDHIKCVYEQDVPHLIAWLAHRVQRPGEKVNHALVLGGLQGIGKDTLIEPVKHAVGPWNVTEVSPKQTLGRFNGFVKSVILRVSEARDLGDVDRYAFYDHCKTLAAAPPDVLRCDEKNLREHAVPNVTGVVITTNHKTNGLYLPADDRRHYVAWSDLTKEDFTKEYWNELWRWYEREGLRHVAAYLATYDLSDFDPKAPPPKTAAFWAIVDANSAPEDSELADVLDRLSMPAATTLADISAIADISLAEWLRDRKNRRTIPHRMESVGYAPVRNPTNKRDGQWKIGDTRHTVYARIDLCLRDQIAAASALVAGR